mgnify:CR=1 FL=1
MKEEVLRVLREECPDIDFNSSNALVDDGILDSLAITGIIAALTTEFGVAIPYEEITEENFNSLDAIANLLEKLKDAAC